MLIQAPDQIKTHKRSEMLIYGGNFFSDGEQGVGSGNEGSVIPYRHLLHLPLYPLSIHTQQFRFLKHTRKQKYQRIEATEKFTHACAIEIIPTLCRRSRVKDRSSEM